MKTRFTRKSQVAVEYLILFVVITSIIAPLTYMIYSSLHTTDIDVSAKVIKNIGLEIISKAEDIYYLAPPSKISFTAEFPTRVLRIENITESYTDGGVTTTNYVVSFLLEGDVEVPLVSKVPIFINESNISKGTKTIVVFTNTSTTDDFFVTVKIE
ncbi:MAG: hypothetical protein PWP03_57 [Candidatus Woesearchaeota archaeon]|nr:hypothetical protein [Candidatus Woesearchaeota archaeon]MDN5327419.1 hypothetical protein [Candidatus Woesearchaeota archaeon]